MVVKIIFWIFLGPDPSPRIDQNLFPIRSELIEFLPRVFIVKLDIRLITDVSFHYKTIYFKNF